MSPVIESMRERLHLTLSDELPPHPLPAWADPFAGLDAPELPKIS